MDVHRALTRREKIAVLAVIAAVLILVGLLRPLWLPQTENSRIVTEAEDQ
ncbi:MAG: hypothetical protein II759_02735 [Lachnospiraceae bacterium]|nr:hypothetical protein [Lachnospiraceae bacterium]